MGFFNIFSKEKKEVLDKGLDKTKQTFFSKLSKAVVGKSKVDDEVLDTLEEILVTSDVGVNTTLKIIQKIEERVARDKFETWERIKKGIYPLYILIGLLITILAIFWGYNISSIAEPIGGIKAEIKYYKKYKDEEIKPAIDKINEIDIRLKYLDTDKVKQNQQ